MIWARFTCQRFMLVQCIADASALIKGRKGSPDEAALDAVKKSDTENYVKNVANISSTSSRIDDENGHAIIAANDTLAMLNELLDNAASIRRVPRPIIQSTNQASYSRSFVSNGKVDKALDTDDSFAAKINAIDTVIDKPPEANKINLVKRTRISRNCADATPTLLGSWSVPTSSTLRTQNDSRNDIHPRVSFGNEEERIDTKKIVVSCSKAMDPSTSVMPGLKQRASSVLTGRSFTPLPNTNKQTNKHTYIRYTHTTKMEEEN